VDKFCDWIMNTFPGLPDILRALVYQQFLILGQGHVRVLKSMLPMCVVFNLFFVEQTIVTFVSAPDLPLPTSLAEKATRTGPFQTAETWRHSCPIAGLRRIAGSSPSSPITHGVENNQSVVDYRSATQTMTLQRDWELVYSSPRDGLSFNRLIHGIMGYAGPTLFILRNEQGELFGAYAGWVMALFFVVPVAALTRCCCFDLCNCIG